MRLNKHLFISCFHKTDGEVVLCSGRRNYFKSLQWGDIVTRSCSAVLWTRWYTSHCNFLSGASGENERTRLRALPWGYSVVWLLRLFPHPTVLSWTWLNRGLHHAVYNERKCTICRFSHLSSISGTKEILFCKHGLFTLLHAVGLRMCCLGGEWGPFHHWHGLKRDASDAWKGSAVRGRGCLHIIPRIFTCQLQSSIKTGPPNPKLQRAAVFIKMESLLG